MLRVSYFLLLKYFVHNFCQVNIRLLPRKNVILEALNMNLLRIIVLFLLLSFTTVFYAAQSLQAIHNSADPVLDSIDVYIYVFGSPYDTLQDVSFREGTPFVVVDFPINLTLDIGIAPGNSTSASDTLRSFHIILPVGATYIGLIQGVTNTSQFAPNPDGLDISLNAVINQNGRITSNNPGEVDLFFVHGVTDAPTIDLTRFFLNSIP